MPRKSIGEYPPNWPEISKAVKDDAGWKCVRCHHPHDIPAGYVLTVHHLDLHPDHCQWWNIPALCQRCHLQIQHKVVMERDWMFEHSVWFKPYVAVHYGIQAGVLPQTFDYYDSLVIVRREFVISNMEYLLSLGQVYRIEQEIIQNIVGNKAAIQTVLDAEKAKAAG
jgi:hypothetical protein